MFHGSMVALVTPMDLNGEINFGAFADLIDYHIESGTRALIVSGSTGESATLTADEKRKLFAFAVKHSRERLPVIAGTHAEATTEAIHLTQMAMEQGVDACLIMTPAYIKPTQAGLIQHYRAIASAVPIPIILYNVPGRTACDLLPETMAVLAEVSNIIGVKDATDLDRVSRIKKLTHDNFDVYSGEDGIAFESVKRGAQGVISVTANVAAKPMAEMMSLALEGKFDEAAAIDKKLQALHQALFTETNPIPCKWALYHMGLIPEGIRLPLTPLTDVNRERLAKALALISG